MTFWSAISTRFNALLSQPETELTRWQRTVSGAVALAVHCGVQLRRDRAPQMAAALAYRTLFGLIPTLVLSLIILRFFYADSIEAPLRRVLDYIGLGELEIAAEEGATAAADGAHQVTDWIEDLVARVSELNFAAIGAVGVIVLIYAALSLMAQVEQAFNTVYKAPAGRKALARITQYWTLLTLAPLGIVASFWLSDRFRSIVQEIGGSGLVSMFGIIAAFSVSWIVLLLAYVAVPNARVHIRAALVGSFVAAVLWEFGKAGFSMYLGFATGYARFYGSLGLIPIFMLWIYITWLIVLFGLELSYAMQTLDRGLDSFRQRRAKKRTSSADPSHVVTILAVIGDAFTAGDSLTTGEITSRAGVDASQSQAALDTLMDTALVHQVEQASEAPTRWSLSRPPDQIRLDDLWARLNDGDGDDRAAAAHSAFRRINEGVASTLKGCTLASVLPEASDQDAS